MGDREYLYAYVEVAEVDPNGPAGNSGLQVGDIPLFVDHKPLFGSAGRMRRFIQDFVAAHGENDPVELNSRRDGTLRSVMTPVIRKTDEELRQENADLRAKFNQLYREKFQDIEQRIADKGREECQKDPSACHLDY